MIRSDENEFSHFRLEDGIIYFIYKPISYLTLSITQQIVSNRISFQEDEAYPIFCDTRGLSDSSKEARDFLAYQGSILTKAIALYDDRNLAKFMLDYYHLRNRPLVPSLMFDQPEAALEFLKEFKAI